MEIVELEQYTDAIACLRQTLKEGHKDNNVDIHLMVRNISRCEKIVKELRQTQKDPVHCRTLTSLSCNLSASKNILMRKIQHLKDSSKNTATQSSSKEESGEAEDTKKKERRLRQLTIEETILQTGDVRLEDVVGLVEAKQALQEAVIMPLVFPQLFLGGRKPWKRILLYGAPGTGKSRLAQAISSEIKSMFYCVSSTDLMSSWVGESEKLIKELFQHAANQQGRSVIFIDEIDSICRQRCVREDEHTRRIKTELLKQMEGADSWMSSERLFLMCATNCPWELDTAFLRRFQKRIYIPLPDRDARIELMKLHSRNTALELNEQDWAHLADGTHGYSGSDLASLTLGALFQPVRDLQQATHWRQLTDGQFMACSVEQQGAFVARLSDLPPDKITVRNVDVSDFVRSIATHMRTVSTEELDRYHHFSLGDNS